MTKRIHWAWIVLLASSMSVFIAYSIRLSYSILMPEMIKSLKISKAEAGAVASSFNLVYSFFTPFLGYLVDRASARKILTFFGLILGVGTFLMSQPTSLPQACFFFAVVGFGSSAMWTPVVALVQRWFGAKRRGLILGLLSISYAFGYGIMGLVHPLLVARYDWRTCWFLLSFLALATVPINALFLRNKPQDLNLRPWGEEAGLLGEAPPEPKVKMDYKELLKLGNLWWAGVAYFFSAFNSYVVNTFMVTYGNLELGVPYAQAAKLASTIAFCGMAGAIGLPLLSDYWGRKKILIVGNFLMGLSVLLIIWAGKSWFSLVMAVGFFGIFYAGVWPLYAAAAADYFPPEVTGSVLGFWTIFYGLGLVSAPILGGLIADRTGTFVWSFFLAAMSGFLGAFCCSRVQKLQV